MMKKKEIALMDELHIMIFISERFIINGYAFVNAEFLISGFYIINGCYRANPVCT